MATLSDGVFRFLSLCAAPPGSAPVAQRLSTALSAVPSSDALVTAAEQHGMDPLVLAHIERTGLAIPTDLRTRLRARQTQHAHAAAVRARVVADVVSAMAQAVLDRGGRVHPFARPLAIRDGSTACTRRVPVAAFGAEAGSTPLPIGLVLVTSYRVGARWRPRRLTAASTLLALMRHTVAARGKPEHSMPILKHAVTGCMAFAGVRGEARLLVSAVLRHVRTPWDPRRHD